MTKAEADAEMMRLESLQLDMKEKERFKFYVPNAKCEEYINAVGSGEYFVTLFSAANGVGKSACSANIIAHIIWGQDSNNPFFNSPLFKDWPYPKAGRIVSTSTNISKNLIPTLFTWFPAGRYETSKGNKNFESIFKCDNGWMLDIMTYEQDPSEFEGPTFGFVFFDEPPTYAIYKACVSRLRKGGIIFIAATPLLGSAWMYDSFVAPSQNVIEVSHGSYPLE